MNLKNTIKRMIGKATTPPIIDAVRAGSLTYLGEDALHDLYNQVVSLENEKAEGILIEAGCALGGSAIVMTTAKSKSRPFNVYDVFGMIPPPSNKDGQDVHERYETIQNGKSQGLGQNKYYGYEENLLEKVTDHFRKHHVAVEDNNVRLIKGLFQETIQIQEKVAMAHIDGDWYESVITCLQQIEPNLIHGGVLVIDDYNDWSGCRTAVDEYFENKKDEYEFTQRARLHITRK